MQIIKGTSEKSVKRPATPRQAGRRRGAVDALLDPVLFKALADPTRSRLLACVVKCGRACSVTEVSECCSVDFSVVTRHLATLAKAGVLESEKEGRTVWYRVRGEELATRLRALADAFASCGDGSACCGAKCEGC